MKSTILCLLALLLASCGLGMSNEDRLDRAEGALETGDYRAAIIDAKDVLSDEPGNLRGRLLLGRASAAIGDGASAEIEMRRALELGATMDQVIVPLARGLQQQRKFQSIIDEIEPDMAAAEDEQIDLELIRGNAFIGLSQPDEARSAFDNVLARAPENIEAYLGIASSYLLEDKQADARKTLDFLTSMYPDDFRGWLAAGEYKLGIGDFAAAVSDFETATRLSSAGDGNQRATIRALTGLADSQLAVGQLDSARETILRLAGIAPGSLEASFLTARVAFVDEDWGTAQQNLQAILQRFPEYLPAQTLLGAVHLQSGNYSQADMYLSAVVAAQPNDDQARRLLAETRIKLRNVGDAESLLAPLIEADNANPTDLAMAARVSFGKGDVDTAIDLLKRSAEENPDNTAIKFQLATALLGAGRNEEFGAVLDNIDTASSPLDEFRRDLLEAMLVVKSGGADEALTSAKELVGDWPKNSEARNLLGSVQASQQDLEGARASFLESLEFTPGNRTALQSLAVLNEQLGEIDSAVSRYELILESQPDSIWAMYGIARLNAIRGNRSESIVWLEKIRSLDPNAVRPRASLGAMLLADGRADEARVVVEEAISVNGDVAELYHLLGRIQLAKDDFRAAADAFENALVREPENSQYRLSLAEALRRSGESGEAEQLLFDRGEVDLADLSTGVTAAALKVENRDFEGAIEIARKLQRAHATSPVPFALEAEILLRDGRLEAGVEAYERALGVDVLRSHAVRLYQVKAELGHTDRDASLRKWLSKNEDDTEIRAVLADSLLSSSQVAEAITEYETVLEYDADNAVVLNNLAWAYFQEQDSRAVSTARKALSLMPDSGAVADTLGWILVETGEIGEGVDVLERAVVLSGGRPEIRYHYAAGLVRAGEPAKARQILEEIVSSNTDFPGREDAKVLLAQL